MLTSLYARLIGAGLLLTLIVGAVLWEQHRIHASYAAGVTDGRNAVIAEDAVAAASAKVQQDIRDAASAQAGGVLQHALATQLPAIQAKTHDTAESIRIVYRDRPGPADACTRPDGVQQALDAAVRRANAATGGEL